MDFATFQKEREALLKTFPRKPNTIINCDNSPYGDMIVNCRNVYYGFDAVECENSFYLYDAFKDTNCIDCSYTAKSELCHESTDAFECYNCSYVYDCAKCSGVSYSMYCTNCQDCFGCVSLKSKQFCFFNQQLTEEAYKKRVAEYQKKSPAEIWAEVDALRSTFPNPPVHATGNENTEYGEYFYFNRDGYYLFDSTDNDACSYLYDSHRNKYCLDMSYSADQQLCYECTDCINSYESFHGFMLEKSNNTYFCNDCNNCQDCIGCAFLSNKQYCILNKQYSQEEYEKLKKEILGTM